MEFETIVDLMRSDGYITVNKKLAKSIGLHESIIYGELLSRYSYFMEHDKLTDDGYFFNTVEDLQEATTLSKHKQLKAIENLYNYNLIERKVMGLPAKRYFKINEDVEALYRVFGEESQLFKNSPTGCTINEQQESKKVNSNNINYNTKKETKSIEYRTHKQDYESDTFDFEILENQLRGCYNKLDMYFTFEEVLEVFKYFINKHKQHCEFEHPRISNSAIDNILNEMSYVDTYTHGQMDIAEIGCYFDMIDFYWKQAVNRNFKGNERNTINYSVMHFMSRGIKANCFYKTSY